MIVSFQASRALVYDHIDWDHNHLLSDLATCKVSVSVHSRMHRNVGDSVAQVSILAISGTGPDDLSRVQILDG